MRAGRPVRSAAVSSPSARWVTIIARVGAPRSFATSELLRSGWTSVTPRCRRARRGRSRHAPRAAHELHHARAVVLHAGAPLGLGVADEVPRSREARVHRRRARRRRRRARLGRRRVERGVDRPGDRRAARGRSRARLRDEEHRRRRPHRSARAASMRQRPTGATASSRAATVSTTRRATADLQSIASVASRPSSASSKRTIIHSETSKLLLPVSASRPRRPGALVFAGEVRRPIAPSCALVTHGGIADARGAALASPRSSRFQSVAKKSAT